MYSLLIVDDMQITADCLAKDIDWNSIDISRVFVAYDSKESMRIIENNHIDVMITDIKMPGKDGLELITMLKQLPQNTKVIIYSAYDEFGYAQRAIELGVDSFITKPASYDDIKSKVKRSVKRIVKIDTLTSDKTKDVIQTTPIPPISKDNSIIRGAKQLIFENIQKSFSLQQIADHIHVHPNYLSRLFKETQGCTIFEYIISKKMDLAIKLLKEPSVRVSDIPDMLGYESLSYFSRIFKRETGYSPKEYINRYR